MSEVLGTDRVQRGPKDPTQVDLRPEEYFVLSRVEAPCSVAELIACTGLPRADTERIVAHLLQTGLLEPSKPEVDRTDRPGKSRLRTRQLELLRSNLGASAREAQAVAVDDPAESGTGHAHDASHEHDDGFVEITVRVSADDPRVDSRLAIPVDEQRWILTLADGGADISPFEFLGARPTHDATIVKRAYHRTSRRLHPDAYYQRDIGPFRAILSELFKRARYFYAELGKHDVRAAWVDRSIELEAAYRRRATAAQEASKRAELEAERVARELDEAAASTRRRTREVRRIERTKSELLRKRVDEADAHRVAAEQALAAGELAKAANFYRLALRARPGDPGLEQAWSATLEQARVRRAAEAFNRATRCVDVGHVQEALGYFLEAADAHPTAQHLASATQAIAGVDPARARDLALSALDALASEQRGGVVWKPRDEALLRLKIAAGFHAAGQSASAREQLLVARSLRPDDPDVQSLLIKLKVK